MNGDATPDRPEPPSPWRLASAGMELAGAVLGGCLLGYWIDRQFGTGRWGLIIGAGVGIIGGLYNMIRKAVHESLGLDKPARQSEADRSKRQDDADPSPPEPGPS
jgi:F0F1-type ATP synthase assembly protein I